MAKRFTDSEKWGDPWFADLPSKYKLLYLYLIDSCDHAGVWKVNFKLASFMVGENLEPSEVKRILGGRVRFLNDEYWYIEKFIKFQYGALKNDRVGQSARKILENHGLVDVLEELTQGASKGLSSPYLGGKDKDMDKDKDMVKDNSSLSARESEKFLDEIDIKIRDSVILQNLSTTMLSQSEKETYLLRLASNTYCKVIGGNYHRMKLSQVRPDAEYCQRQGWLKTTQDPNTKPKLDYDTILRQAQDAVEALQDD